MRGNKRVRTNCFRCVAQESGARKELDEKFLPRGLKNIEEMLLSNDGGRGWFAGDEVSEITQRALAQI